MGKMTLRRRKTADSPPIHLIPPTAPLANKAPAVVKKKAGGARLWMRMDRWGQSELMECDKSVITKRVSIPARDLRILGPIFSNSSRILAREKAMIVNLEFIRAIVTAEELLLLDPLCHEVLPFLDRLRRHLPRKIPSKHVVGQMVNHDTNMPSHTVSQWITAPEGEQDELPFEFQVLEIALEIICTYLDSSIAELERDAYPVLDELAINVSTKNLEHVRSLKNNLTRLLARVQKVRDEIEHLLDDNDDMTQLYLTRKWIQNQQTEALYSTLESNSVICAASHLRRLNSSRSASLLNSHQNDHHDVEDLEMLLEAYFIQLDRTRNKILSVREYIDDTEDYMNIKLDNKRNELIQLQLIMTIAALAVAVETLLAGWFGMNIPCSLYNITGIFGKVVGLMTAASVALFSLIYGYARWKKLLGS